MCAEAVAVAVGVVSLLYCIAVGMSGIVVCDVDVAADKGQ